MRMEDRLYDERLTLHSKNYGTRKWLQEINQMAKLIALGPGYRRVTDADYQYWDYHFENGKVVYSFYACGFPSC